MALLTTKAAVAPETEKANWLDAWHVSPSANREYDFIDGLRGIAILMVIAGHGFYINPKAGSAVKVAGSIIGTGGYGVTLFFVLSGFLISWPFWKRKIGGATEVVPRGYAQRRFWKIYPPLALSIILFTPLFACILDPANGSSYIPMALRWLSGIAFVWPVSGKLNPVMWTLALEVQFYALLPAVFWVFRRFSAKTCLAGFTVLFLVVPFIFRVVTRQGPAFYPEINSHFPSGLDYFYLGILVAGLDNLGIVKKQWHWWGIAGVALWPLSLLLGAWIDFHMGTKTFAVSEFESDSLKIAAGCLLLFIAAPRHPIARLLCAPWLRWCGIISYEWYLFHQPLMTWWRAYFGMHAGGAVFKYAFITGMPLVIGLLLSAAIYWIFSLPLLRYGRSKNRG